MRSHFHRLQDLPGMAQEFQERLATLGIETTDQLLQRTRTSADKSTLAHQMDLPLRYIEKWIALADLARIPSVGCQYNGLLLHTGILSVSQLAQIPPGNLHPRLRRLHVATLRRSDLCPKAAEVAVWIQEAKLLAAQNCS